MHAPRAMVLAALACAVLPAVAFARCEGYVPQAKPQNTFPQDVGRSFDRVLEEGWIEFAAHEDFPPWSVKKHGHVHGIDVDIGRLIAAALGVEARFRLVQAGETLDSDLLNYVWKGAMIGSSASGGRPRGARAATRRFRARQMDPRGRRELSAQGSWLRR